jgi:hypothetical protein
MVLLAMTFVIEWSVVFLNQKSACTLALDGVSLLCLSVHVPWLVACCLCLVHAPWLCLGLCFTFAFELNKNCMHHVCVAVCCCVVSLVCCSSFSVRLHGHLHGHLSLCSFACGEMFVILLGNLHDHLHGNLFAWVVCAL